MLQTQVPALGIGIMLVRGEEADGLAEEGVGALRGASGLCKAAREGVAEHGGRRQVVVVGGYVAGGRAEALLVGERARRVRARCGQSSQRLRLDEDAEAAVRHGLGGQREVEADARAEEAAVVLIDRAVAGGRESKDTVGADDG